LCKSLTVCAEQFHFILDTYCRWDYQIIPICTSDSVPLIVPSQILTGSYSIKTVPHFLVKVLKQGTSPVFVQLWTSTAPPGMLQAGSGPMNGLSAPHFAKSVVPLPVTPLSPGTYISCALLYSGSINETAGSPGLTAS